VATSDCSASHVSRWACSNTLNSTILKTTSLCTIVHVLLHINVYQYYHRDTLLDRWHATEIDRKWMLLFQSIPCKVASDWWGGGTAWEGRGGGLQNTIIIHYGGQTLSLHSDIIKLFEKRWLWHFHYRQNQYHLRKRLTLVGLFPFKRYRRFIYPTLSTAMHRLLVNTHIIQRPSLGFGT